MVVTNIEPFRLLVLVRPNELVRQVLVGRVFSHLNTNTSDHSRVVASWLWLQSEEFSKQDSMGLDFHKCFAEVHKHRDVENAIGVQV
jgi:hypothetical protein